MQANYTENEIKSLLQKARIFNKEIGSYELFAITESFDYAVKLTNGRIIIKLEELQDDAQDALTPDQLTRIANRFVSSSSGSAARDVKTERQTEPQRPYDIYNENQKKDKRKVFLIVGIILITIILAVVFFNSNTYNNGGYGGSDSYENRVMSIEETERSQPTQFLSAEGNYRENFWGNKFKLECIIKNRATVATYKDVKIMITYYTKTKTALRTNNYTLYELFPPSSTKKIDLTIDTYKNVHSIGIDILSATPY